MNRGFIRSITYYASGLGLAGLSYLIAGHEYIHAPRLHHVIILLTFIGGLLWLAVAVIRYFNGQRGNNLRALVWTNLVVSVGIALIMVYLIRDATGTGEFKANADNVILETSGDTTTMYHDRSAVYMKVKDSVRINFIDSAKINWTKIERRKKGTP